MRFLVDTSVVIAGAYPAGAEAAISVATLTELHYGVLVAGTDDVRAWRLRRLGLVEQALDAIPVDRDIAREWGRLRAAVRARGGEPRRRSIDLLIAATANVHARPLLTLNIADLRIIDDLVDARAP